jgi:hypothetical protein
MGINLKDTFYLTDLQFKNYVGIIEKNNMAETIVDYTFNVERDEENNIINYDFKQNDCSREILTVYGVCSLYIKNLDFVKEDKTTDAIVSYDLLMEKEIFKSVCEYTKDVLNFLRLVDEKINTFKEYYILDKDRSDLDKKLITFITLFSDKLEAETKELELKNLQSEKFINSMPENIDDMQLDVEKMTTMAQQLNNLENIDLIKKM